MIETVPLEQAAEAYARMMEGKARFRIVLVTKDGMGAIAAHYFGANLLVFAAGVFVLGQLCFIAHADLTAYRFGGIALVIVLLIPRTGPGWKIAFHRFAEVSIGIGVALVLAMMWPEKEPMA